MAEYIIERTTTDEGCEFVAGIPHVTRRVRRRSPNVALRASIFRIERRLRSRKRLELGGSGLETTSSFGHALSFERSGQTCRAAFVWFGVGSRSRA